MRSIKKTLSLLLAFTIVLATLAIPTVTFAAGNEITISYDVKVGETAAGTSESPLYPGDTFTVTVNAAASGDLSGYNYANFQFAYDSTKFEYKSGTAAAASGAQIKDITKAGNKFVQYTYESADLTTVELSSTPTEICTLTFEVVAGAAAGETDFGKNVTADEESAVYVNSAGVTSTFTVTKPETTKLVVGTKEAKALISYGSVTDAEITEGSIIYAESATVKVAASRGITATLTKPDTSVVTIEASGVAISDYGNYTITFSGDVTKTINFSLHEPVSAQIGIPRVDGFTDSGVLSKKASESFTIPVDISELGTAKASTVKFTVNFDPAKVSLAVAGDGVSSKPTETEGVIDVMYGDGSTIPALGITSGDYVTVANLVFTVKADAAVSASTVSISNAGLVLEKDILIDSTDDSIGISTGYRDFVIAPAADDFAAVTDEQEGWTKNDYTVTVAPVTGAEAVYVPSATDITDDQSALAAQFASGTPVPEGGALTVDSADNYYVITRVGGQVGDPARDVYVYQVKKIESKYDNTAPVIDTTKLTIPEGWQNAPQTINLSAEGAVTDARGGALTYQVSYDGTTWTEKAALADFTTPADQSMKSLKVKVFDEAGNDSGEVEIAILIDVTKPVIALTKNEPANGAVTVSIAVEDDGFSPVATADIYFSEAQVTEPTTENIGTKVNTDAIALTKAEGATDYTATYDVDKTGYYYVVVSDGAGNTSISEISVTLAMRNKAADISVKVAGKTADAYIEKAFRTPDDMKALGITDKDNNLYDTNGSFVSVAIKVDTVAGYTNTVVLKKDGAEVTFNDSTPITEIGNYELTVTTTSDTVAADTGSAIYKFSIVATADMLSPNADKRFNIIDLAMLGGIIKHSNGVPTSAHNFYGGYFSGDVTGDLKVDQADYAKILVEILAAHIPGEYDLPILQPITD